MAVAGKLTAKANITQSLLAAAVKLSFFCSVYVALFQVLLPIS